MVAISVYLNVYPLRGELRWMKDYLRRKGWIEKAHAMSGNPGHWKALIIRQPVTI